MTMTMTTSRGHNPLVKTLNETKGQAAQRPCHHWASPPSRSDHSSTQPVVDTPPKAIKKEPMGSRCIGPNGQKSARKSSRGSPRPGSCLLRHEHVVEVDAENAASGRSLFRNSGIRQCSKRRPRPLCAMVEPNRPRLSGLVSGVPGSSSTGTEWPYSIFRGRFQSKRIEAGLSGRDDQLGILGAKPQDPYS